MVKFNNPFVEYHLEVPEMPAHVYLFPDILKVIDNLNESRQSTILDVGCGGGAFLDALYKRGFRKIYGFDSSVSGIAVAKKNFSHLMDNYFVHSAYDERLPNELPRQFDIITSTEVIEHLYSPKTYLTNLRHWLKDDGYLIISTPYHGYLKNLGIALLGGFDNHFNSIYDGEHIKFVSKRTINKLLADNGFQLVKFQGSGRAPFLWRSMILLIKKRL